MTAVEAVAAPEPQNSGLIAVAKCPRVETTFNDSHQPVSNTSGVQVSTNKTRVDYSISTNVLAARLSSAREKVAFFPLSNYSVQ